MEPFPDHRGRLRVRNLSTALAVPAAGDFIMYVFDGDSYYGVFYDIDQDERIVTVNSIFVARTLQN